MRLLTISADSAPTLSKLALSLASTSEEVREVQRLRYQVFIETMGLTSLINQDGLDQDEFDECCDHLLVRDTRTLKVVGTYRVLSPDGARRLGRYYSEQEFDLARLSHLRGRLAEAGRACIHPDYRSGGVIMMLWAGLAAYLKREKCDYLVGCASISLSDGGANAAALYHSLADRSLSPAEYRVIPHLPLPLHAPDACSSSDRPAVVVPPLIKGYLRGGAWICGEPAWDPDFHCADLFLLLPLDRLEGRYARRYLEEKRAA